MWLKQNNKKLGGIFFLLLMVIFSTQQIQAAAVLRSSYQAVGVRLTKGEITKQQVEQALKREQDRNTDLLPDLALWRQCEKAEIKNTSLGRSAKVMPMVVSGNMGLVVAYPLISGNFPYAEDSKGCVIDADSAYGLFGTECADGNMIVYQSKSYYIRGVVKATVPLFLIQETSENNKYTNLELLYSDRERGEEFTQNFLVQNGLASDFVVIDAYFYSRMISAVLALPLWLLFLSGVLWLIRQFLDSRNSLSIPKNILYASLCGILMLGFLQLLYQFAGAPFYLPGKLIPTKWSDFDHWERQYQIIKNQVGQFRYLSPNPKDVLLVDELLKLPYQFGLEIILYTAVLIQGSSLGQNWKKTKELNLTNQSNMIDK